MTDAPSLPGRCLVWRRILDDLSLEHLRLQEGEAGPALCGAVVSVEEDRPLRFDYRIRCAGGWETSRVEVRQAYCGEIRRLSLDHHEDRWFVDGIEAPQLQGCTDVDLELSPCSNTLPIRRLGLRVGEAAEIVAAWVLVPSLQVRAAPQRYERLGEHRWRFTGLDTGFTAVLEVDERGLVVEYEGLWRRIADWPG